MMENSLVTNNLASYFVVFKAQNKRANAYSFVRWSSDQPLSAASALLYNSVQNGMFDSDTRDVAATWFDLWNRNIFLNRPVHFDLQVTVELRGNGNW